MPPVTPKSAADGCRGALREDCHTFYTLGMVLDANEVAAFVAEDNFCQSLGLEV